MNRAAAPLDDPAHAPPARSVPSLDSDERTVAWLTGAPDGMALTLHDVASGRETRLPFERDERLAAFRWSFRPGTGIAVAHGLGEEGGALLRFDGAAKSWSSLYAPTGDRLSLIGLSRRRPDDLLVRRIDGPGLHHYESVSIATGRVQALLSGVEAGAVYFDRGFEPRLIETAGADGSRDLWHLEGGAPASLFLHIPHEAALGTRILDFNEAGDAVYLVRPFGPRGAELALFDCDGRGRGVLRSSCHRVARGDVAAAFPPVFGEGPGLLKVERAYSHLVAPTPAERHKLALVRKRLPRRIEMVQRSSSDALWIVAGTSVDRPPRYALVSTAGDWIRELGSRPPSPAPRTLCRPVLVPTRDGGAMTTYVSRADPTARTPGPPIALLVHGGPWRRARAEPLWTRDLLARAGCLVVEPNFRGSTGFGAAWLNAGDGAWGKAMQEDLEDALDWAIRQRGADPERVAVVGGSYGGYAALQMAATTTRSLRAVVATAPLVDLVDFVSDPPVFWKQARAMLRRRIGDVTSETGARALAALSPLNHAGRIRAPTLLVHGTRDPRARADGTAALFMKLAQAGADATLAFFPDEGHEIVGAGNRRALTRLVESFVARNLLGSPAAPFGEARDSSLRLLCSPAAGGRGRRTESAAAAAAEAQGVPVC
jgi:acetyl esterase/lipase